MTGQRITPGLAEAPADVDVVVIGLGVTGTGVALDAVTRGLSVLAVDAHDLAFGTSRWSSKLVHGGLRYLAHGQVGVAHESAVERGILMEVTAPHLTHAMPMLVPLHPSVSAYMAGKTRAALTAGDLLRRGARTSRATLPRPRKISATEALALAPGLRSAGLRGGLLSWDGQLEDDARLVTTIARTAAAYGAHVRTRARVLSATGTTVELRDELTGTTSTVTARTVINATGVWAGELVDEVKLRPSRGTHLVLRAGTLPGLRVSVTPTVPGESNRFALVLPQPDGTIYVGLTDEPVDGEIPDVPTPSEPEIGFLLDVVSAAFARDLRRADVVGAYAGLRPLLEVSTARPTARPRTCPAGTPCSPPASGVVTIVGGKLTTYRRMAEDAIDSALSQCRYRRRPLPDPDPPPRRSRLTGGPGPARAPRAGSSAATAPTPSWCWRAPARSAASPTTSCSPRSPSTSRPRWPSCSSGSPTRAPPTSRTCSTGVPASA